MGSEGKLDVEKLAAIFEAVKVLPLRPGDLLIFRSEDRLTFEQTERVRGLLEKNIPGHRVLVLDGGADIEVLRREDAACVS